MICNNIVDGWHFNMVFDVIPKKDISKLLTTDVIYILKTIEGAGYETRIVGGAVRNWLLGVEISDIDIATTALPEQIFKVFENSNDESLSKVVPTGLEHGTVTLVYKKKGYEITTLREDIETFGRKAKVTFCKSFEKDSNRRDFTINALYMDKDAKIYDYHNGIADISGRIIRFIGDPYTRICEDYLRILRYFRFIAYYGDFRCSPEDLAVIYSLKNKVSELSSERILAEISKIFALDDAYKITPPMAPIMEELFKVSNSEEILKFLQTKLCVTNNQKLSVQKKLALVLKFSAGNLAQLIQKYKFSKQLKTMLSLDVTPEEIRSTKASKKHLKKIHKSNQDFWIVYRTIKKAVESSIFSRNNAISDNDRCCSISEYEELRKFYESGGADFSFRASALDKYSLSTEKLMKVMKRTKEIWQESEEILGPDECLKIAEEIVKSIS